MDEILMLHGVERHCQDCEAVTIFLPVDREHDAAQAAWVCTACDGAVLLAALAA